MKNKIISAILLMMLSASLSAWKITGATEAQKKYIIESIKIRVALESGHFKLTNTLEQYNLSGSVWMRTLIVCSNRYRFRDKITFRPYVLRHSISVYSDLSHIGARYGYSLWRGWGVSIQADSRKNIYCGIEKRL